MEEILNNLSKAPPLNEIDSKGSFSEQNFLPRNISVRSNHREKLTIVRHVVIHTGRIIVS
jgi:hypothetical protein